LFLSFTPFFPDSFPPSSRNPFVSYSNAKQNTLASDNQSTSFPKVSVDWFGFWRRALLNECNAKIDMRAALPVVIPL
jgi:hypothetical protein